MSPIPSPIADQGPFQVSAVLPPAAAGNGHAPVTAPEFDEAFRAQLLQLVAWRRDVRRFRPDPLPPGTLDRFIETACLAPSVGLSQPWRFVTVEDPARREAVRAEFRACNAEALASYAGDRAGRYAALKL
jgi:5,6-dimethylbenzimidazole synthase